MQTQKIHLGDALTIVTGKLLSPNGIDGLLTTLRYLTGDSVFMNQIPRALDVCRPHVLQHCPKLEDEINKDIGRGNAKEYFTDRIAIYGEWVEIPPLAADTFQHGNAITELAEQIGANRVVVAKTN